MTAKTILALLFLISVAVAGTVFARAISRDPPAAPSAAAPSAAAVPTTSTREVLVAAADLSAGAILRPRDVRWSMVPVEPGIGGTIGRSSAAARDGKLDEEMPTDVLGSALRVAVTAGAPIIRADLMRPGDQDFLHLLLAAGDHFDHSGSKRSTSQSGRPGRHHPGTELRQ